MLALLLSIAVQDIPGPPGDDAAAPRTSITRQRCVRNPEEIVVCGESESPRLAPLPEPGERNLIPRAEVRFGGNKRAGLRAENNANPTVSAPRLMLDFTVDF